MARRLRQEAWRRHASIWGCGPPPAGRPATLPWRRVCSPLAVDEAEREALIQPMAARAGAAYMEQMVAAHGVTPAGGIRLWTIYIHTDVGGAPNQAPDGGALLR